MEILNTIPACWRPAMIIAVIGAVLLSVVVVSTPTVDDFGIQPITLANEFFTTDADVDVLSKGVELDTKTASPVGDIPPPPGGGGGGGYR